jgi:GTPase SAR1 family protein
MMMIGDLSAGKSDMIAKYFDKSPHEIFMSLTEDAIIKESKTIECCNKKIKLDCLDTTQGTQNPEMFKNLIKG